MGKRGANRTPPLERYPEWSEAKFWTFVRSGLRSKAVRWPPIYEALNAAKRKSESDNKRLKWEYQCAVCGQWFPRDSVQVDHVVPTGTLRSFEDLPGFVDRLFCASDGLQVICLTDHLVKTAKEKEERKNELSSTG